jgi:hypothetical protein
MQSSVLVSTEISEQAVRGFLALTEVEKFPCH